jgi:hypothetical protein
VEQAHYKSSLSGDGYPQPDDGLYCMLASPGCAWSAVGKPVSGKQFTNIVDHGALADAEPNDASFLDKLAALLGWMTTLHFCEPKERLF